ncbi:shufflon system plasmid conjugative transfer pilus tip adhesin PilV [Halodesulfovibrio aestuarii]|uniref:Shufflon protein, N-terminal constant region n=1 Tax=Halodesulfovibrio aestuarii TaxID=126333 RepID=A0A8G2C9A7_9BACT|nr:shufflon system plasmid conjugative transfer pilus tip adhesin PilV [Halodesulfovibrio aestuarii]SHJ06295.1 shufflon protein, N-terminal constant region [Halodesulfovibrio aestuarii]
MIKPQKVPQQQAHPEGGFATLDVLAALLMLLILMPVLVQYIEDGLESTQQKAIASHLSTVTKAVSKYTKEHRAELLAAATDSTAKEVAFNDIRSAGFLPASFSNKNAWGQTYRIFVLEPDTDTLQAVVLTYGGRTYTASKPKFASATVPATAAMVGANGGFIPTGFLTGQTNQELRGAFSGWVLPLAATNIPIPPAGHLGSLVFYDDYDIRQDYLYRFAVPGKPELNEMHTELDMTTNAIRNVGEIQFVKHDTVPVSFCDAPEDEGTVFLHKDYGLYICRDQKAQTIADTGNTDLVKNTALAANGDRFKKPKCPEGTNTTPGIFVSPTIVAEGPLAKPMVTFQSWALDLGDEWEVKLRVKTDEEEGYRFPTANYARMNVQTFCANDSNN